MANARPIPEAHVIRRLAVEASADPRTVLRVLQGAPVRGAVRERIDRVLRAHGLIERSRSPGWPYGQ